MEDIKYNPKDYWDKGEWDNEPDKLEFEYRGIQCEIRRNPVFGSLCGYVLIPKGNPWIGKGESLSMHGGETYYEDLEDGSEKIGFDCGHYNDRMPYNAALAMEQLMKIAGTNKNVKRLYELYRSPVLREYNDRTYKNIGFVKNELENIVNQILDELPNQESTCSDNLSMQ